MDAVHCRILRQTSVLGGYGTGCIYKVYLFLCRQLLQQLIVFIYLAVFYVVMGGGHAVGHRQYLLYVYCSVGISGPYCVDYPAIALDELTAVYPSRLVYAQHNVYLIETGIIQGISHGVVFIVDTHYQIFKCGVHG